MLENLKSHYILEIILNYITKKKSLEIIKCNKKIQQRLNINIKDYKNYSEMYSSIEIDIIPNTDKYREFINISEQDKKFYHIYLNKENNITTKIIVKIDYQVKSFFELFKSCSFKSITFRRFTRNNINNMSSMFYHTKVDEIIFNQCNTVNVTDMSYMFMECNSLKKLDVSKFNTVYVKNMSRMFRGCDSLKELDLSNFRTNNVTDMNNMFAFCHSLEKLNVSNFNTKNVTDMHMMFTSCRHLTKLDISSFKLDNVNNMNHMFMGCESLIELTMTNFNSDFRTQMSNIFVDCPKDLQKKIKKNFKSFKNEAFDKTCIVF